MEGRYRLSKGDCELNVNNCSNYGYYINCFDFILFGF